MNGYVNRKAYQRPTRYYNSTTSRKWDPDRSTPSLSARVEEIEQVLRTLRHLPGIDCERSNSLSRNYMGDRHDKMVQERTTDIKENRLCSCQKEHQREMGTLLSKRSTDDDRDIRDKLTAYFEEPSDEAFKNVKEAMSNSIPA